MAAITSQRDLREVRDLPFCHVCGLSLSAHDDFNHDHVPPQTCFDKSDRNPPLKLRTHIACNNENKLNDEKVGELIAAQRNKTVDPTQTRLRIELMHDTRTGRQYAGFENLDVSGAIRRWVGGFHAALYRQPLIPGTPFQVTAPLPHAKVIGQDVVIQPIPPQHAAFVQTLKLNRAAGNLDLVSTSNGKLRYETVWAQEDKGSRWFCIFALNLYDWIGLGDTRNFEPRGCVGSYMLHSADVPLAASRVTRIQAPIQNDFPHDPFAS